MATTERLIFVPPCSKGGTDAAAVRSFEDLMKGREGGFANRCAYRVLVGEAVVAALSHCEYAQREGRWFANTLLW